MITGEGGSIPVVGEFERLLHAPVLLVGFGLPGENAHAPDEWISQENFRKGMRAIAALQKEQVEKLNPLWAQLNVARKRQHDLWAAFGLDPSSRTRVHTVQAPGNGNAQATKPPVKQANDYFN